MNSARSQTTADQLKYLKSQAAAKHRVQSTLNSSRLETQTTELSPKHSRPAYYYKEGELIKGAKAFTSNINNRFGTNILDNRSLIMNSLQNKNLQESYDQLLKRSDAIAKYYNQDFNRNNNSSIDHLNESKRSYNAPQINLNQSPMKIDEMQQSLSKSRDQFNEVFVNDEQLMEQSRSGFSSPKFRVQLGVFGQFNVNILPQVQTASNQQKRLLFRTMDRIQPSAKTPYSQVTYESRVQTGATALGQIPQNMIKNMNDQSAKRGRSVTETIRTSRQDSKGQPIHSSMYTESMNGEAHMNRPLYLNKNFLTNDEKKFGNCKNLDNIDKSFSKLTALKDRNWSQRDINKNIYTSPSNFNGTYSTQFNSKFNSILTSNKMKKGTHHDINNDFKMTQANHINQMIQLKKTQQLRTQDLKNELSMISSQINNDQKYLYNTLREHNILSSEKRDNSFQRIVNDKGQLISPKVYSSNQQSKLLWEAKERQKQSPMGMQKAQFDIISMRDKLSSVNELKNRVMLKKVNGISQYAQDTHITAPNYNRDYQKAYQQDTGLFRRGQGMLSKFANSAASHKLIMPAFKKA